MYPESWCTSSSPPNSSSAIGGTTDVSRMKIELVCIFSEYTTYGDPNCDDSSGCSTLERWMETATSHASHVGRFDVVASLSMHATCGYIAAHSAALTTGPLAECAFHSADGSSSQEPGPPRVVPAGFDMSLHRISRRGLKQCT